MDNKDQSDLIKIGAVTVAGLVAFFIFVFWLKGHEIRHYARFTFYFKNVNGLEAGAALRWNGLKIGVVESVSPVEEDLNLEPLPADELISFGKQHLKLAEQSLRDSGVDNLAFARENINRAQTEIALGQASRHQHKIKKGEHVKVETLVTTKNVPVDSLNQVTIAPSGLIGEQYVDIVTINLDKKKLAKLKDERPIFVVLEPTRLDTLIRVNVESSEAIRDFANRLNASFTNEDIDTIKVLFESLSTYTSDKQLRENIKESVENINKVTRDFKVWKYLF